MSSTCPANFACWSGERVKYIFSATNVFCEPSAERCQPRRSCLPVARKASLPSTTVETWVVSLIRALHRPEASQPVCGDNSSTAYPRRMNVDTRQLRALKQCFIQSSPGQGKCRGRQWNLCYYIAGHYT